MEVILVETTYRELDESERHVLLIATNFHKTCAKRSELDVEFLLQRVVLHRLRQTNDIVRQQRPDKICLEGNKTYFATKTQAEAG